MGEYHFVHDEHVERSIDLAIEHFMCDERVMHIADLPQFQRRRLMKFYWDAMPHIGQRLRYAGEDNEHEEVLQRLGKSTVCRDLLECELYRAYISAHFQRTPWLIGNTLSVYLRADDTHFLNKEQPEHVANYLASLRFWTAGELANPPRELITRLITLEIIPSERAETLVECLK
ncbi:MAG: hypothetical protein AABY13_04440 [Nanoarchaeota archaeon]